MWKEKLIFYLCKEPDKFKFVELRKSALEREVNMSRIHAGECEHMDMEWYGVDRQGNVAVLCSGGVGN